MPRPSHKPKRLILGGLVLVVGLVLCFLLVLALPRPWPEAQTYGVSFSAPHAEGLGLNWQEAFRALLDDLGVRRLRLAAYWSAIESLEGQFDFADLDYQMDEAASRGALVILGIGRKLPRWPECHTPPWAREKSEAEQQAAILQMLDVVIKRYREHPALRMWQLENEPLLDFGDCPPEDREFLKREEELIRSLDRQHPILITDSGELNSWLPAAGFGDVLGTTMYRTVYSRRTAGLFSYDYIFPAWAYRLKSRLVRVVTGKSVLIAELQGEPWGIRPWTQMTAMERAQSLSVARLRNLRSFAARTQLPEAYWWGAEYWYWELVVNDEPVFWETARTFF